MLDASVLIAALAREAGRVEDSRAVLLDAESADIETYLPMITRVEVTRYGVEAGDADHAEKLTEFLDSRWFNWVEVDRRLADAARDLVRTTSIRKGADALYPPISSARPTSTPPPVSRSTGLSTPTGPRSSSMP